MQDEKARAVSDADPVDPEPSDEAVSGASDAPRASTPRGWPLGRAATALLLFGMVMAGHGITVLWSSRWTPHTQFPFELIFFLPLFPAGLTQPLGVPTVGAAILGCLIYAVLIVAGAAMCKKPWFRRFVIGFGLLILLNIAGCRWGNPKDLEGFSQAPLRAAGKTA